MSAIQDILSLADTIHYQSRLLKFQSAIIDQFTYSESIWYAVSNATESHFELVSPMFCRRLGYTHREMCERPYLDFMHPECKARTLAAMADLSETDNNQYHLFRNRYLTSSGEVVYLEWMDAIKLKGGSWLATVKEVDSL